MIPTSEATPCCNLALQALLSTGKSSTNMNLAYVNNHDDRPLSESADDAPLPISVFIHGLDSSSHTWGNILSAIAPYSISFAIDLRGNGKSPLGDPDEFSVNSIVEDLDHLLQTKILVERPVEKVILVGHSMGARVASCYAAKYPSRIKALIMEDMDIRSRTMETNPVPMKYDQIKRFRKKFESIENVMDALLKCGYPVSMVNKWVEDGRVRKETKVESDGANESYFWTDVNPEMRWLAYKHIMCTSDGEDAWRTIASSNYPFSCHVMASGIQSQCDEDNLSLMKEIMKERMILHRFPKANHSIHRTGEDDYMKILSNIMQSSDKRG